MIVNWDAADWGKGFKLKYELRPVDSGVSGPTTGQQGSRATYTDVTGCLLRLDFTNLQTRVWVNVIVPSTSLSLRFKIHG